MSKANSPHERIRAVQLSRSTEVLWLTPFNGRYFHHCFIFFSHFHILYLLFMFSGSAVGEVERSLVLDKSGRVLGAGDVFGAMRSSIVHPPWFELLRPTQLDVAGSLRSLTLLIRGKRRLIQSCFMSLIDRRLRPYITSQKFQSPVDHRFPTIKPPLAKYTGHLSHLSLTCIALFS